LTLIIALANPEQAIQVSDRRLTVNGQLDVDESNKAAVLICTDARLAIGFTGLAKIGDFATRHWLFDAIYECSPPDYRSYYILERLTERATSDFQSLPSLKAVPQRDKRLSVMFSGYLHHEDPPLGYLGILTNYQNFKTGIDHSEAWDHFELHHWFEKRPLEHPFTLVQRIGAYAAMTTSDEKDLRQLLQELKPAKAIIGKAIEVIRDMTDRPKAKGLIGKQLSTIIIPRELPSSVEVSYHSDIVTYNAYAPAQIVALSDENRHIILEASMQRGDEKGLKPIAFPKIGRNAPCPCKSGKKYKKCCGR
jgi:hypothetical protein